MRRNVAFALLLVVALLPLHLVAETGAGQKAVLVTGASSGIGRNIAERLASAGHHVYAGARKDKDLETLNGIANIQAVRLDVTSDEDIAAVVALVREQGMGLHGVVNNAGIALIGPVLDLPESDLDKTFAVNVYGPYRINQAFAPLVIESKGRITTIGSVSGIMSGPRSGVYSMSKFAMEAYTDALAAEIAGTGVHVSIIEPGAFKSRIREKMATHMLAQADAGIIELSANARKSMENIEQSNAQLKEPDAVADAVMHALFADQPKRRYMVSPDARGAEMTIKALLTRLVQLNTDQPYSYSRDELVAMLDELLKTD